MFQSICHPGPSDLEGKTELYWGNEFELCVLCPQPGAICKPSSLDDPLSQNGFWKLALDLRCLMKEIDVVDAITKKTTTIQQESLRSLESPYACVKGFHNLKQTKRAITDGRCSVNRTDHSLIDVYPNIHLRGNCYDFAACKPKESCTGNNTCSEEYRWTLDQCKKWERGSKLRRLPLKGDYGQGEGAYVCETDYDCRTRSGNAEILNGADNPNKRPMDGAYCATIRGENGTLIKRCQCKPSERCAMCTVYTHLRKDGECGESKCKMFVVIFLYFEFLLTPGTT